MKPGELETADFTGIVAGGAPFDPVADGLAGRLVRLSHGLLALYLAALLCLPDVQTGLAGLTCLAALLAVVAARRQGGRRVLAPGQQGAAPLPRLPGGWQSRKEMLVLLGPALAWAAIVAGQIVTGHAASKVANQFTVVVCVTLVALSRVPPAWPDCRRWLLPGAAIGAIGAGLLAAWQAGVQSIERPYGWLGASALGTGSIKFGDLAAVLALLALVLVQTSRGWRRGLGLAGIVGGTMALTLSQARGGVLGVLIAVVALALALALASRRRRRGAARLPTRGGALSGGPSVRRLTAMASIAVVAIGLMGLSMHQRFADIEPQIARFQRGDASSEAGQRIALWQAAIRAGLHSPWTGAGLGGGFAKDIERQFAVGDIPPTMRILYGQPHNEYLNGLASAGIPGLVIIVLLFWWPALSLFRRIARGRDSPEARSALVVTASFAGFALTDSMFDRQITIIAFFLLSAWFLRMAGSARGLHDG